MSNKYLEKSAAMFPSIGYQKHLSKDDKKEYANAYKSTTTSSVKNFSKDLGGTALQVAGSAAGLVGGHALSKKPAQAVARHILKKNLVKGVSSEMAIAKGAGAHSGVRLAGALAGAVIGSLPGLSIRDRVSHNYAKSVTEKKKAND
jgi:hypothetical protein